MENGVFSAFGESSQALTKECGRKLASVGRRAGSNVGSTQELKTGFNNRLKSSYFGYSLRRAGRKIGVAVCDGAAGRAV